MNKLKKETKVQKIYLYRKVLQHEFNLKLAILFYNKIDSYLHFVSVRKSYKKNFKSTAEVN